MPEPHATTPGNVEVLLPCLDEAEGLAWLLPRVPQGVGAVVADNGSTDRSVEIARDHGAAVVQVPERGYGAACHAALLAARAELVVIMDADGTCDPAQIDRLLDPVRSGTLDLVLGARRPVSRRAQPWRLRVANRALASRLNARTGLAVHDLGAMRAARRRDLVALGMRDRRFGYPAETVVLAADAGWRVGEAWVDYRVRSGRSKVTGTWRGTLRAIRDLSGVINEVRA
jgi:glycosyltransferase involved in cell wall biosynthesis